MSLAKRLTLCLIVPLAVGGCLASAPVRTQEMHQLGSALTKLTAATDAAAMFDDLPTDLSEEEFIRRATAHDPGLAAPFKDFTLRVVREGKHTAALVCSKDGRFALLEDVGCTTPMDNHSWTASPQLPCEFTLHPSELCRDSH